MTNYLKTKIRVAIYVRVSTQEQAKEGYSIGEQTDRLTKFCEAHDWTIVKVYTDAGHSGANQIRPALQELKEDIVAGRIDKVLVYKLDRLSRSQKDTLELIEDVFLKNNTDFESMTEKLDTATPHGRAMIGILAAFAQLEREMIKERMSMGRDARIKEGKWKGGAVVPFGYDYESTLEKLVVNEYESMIIKNIFEDFTKGKSLNGIADEMIAKGQTLHNGKVDTRNLHYFLRNKTYCGYLRIRNEWVKGLHDPIISEETYDAAQVILDENKRKFDELGIKVGASAISTCLGSFVYCARCGARYGKVQIGTEKYGFKTKYGCYSRHKKIKSMIKDPNCKNKYYLVEDLDNIIWNEIRKLSIDPEYIDKLKNKSEKTPEMEQIMVIEKQIKSISNQLSKYADLYSLGTYTLKELDDKTKPLAEQRDKLMIDLEKIKTKSSLISADQVIKIVSSFEEVLEKGNLQDKRTIIEQLISKIEIDGDDITIHWNFI